MSAIEVYLVGLAAALGLMTALWLASLALRNSSIVDIFWGAGFVVLGWLYFLLGPQGFPLRKLLVGILVAIWGLRLSLYILSRNRGKGEDFRYVAMRRAAGAAWWWQSYLKVFVLQGVLMWLISAPLLAAQLARRPARRSWTAWGCLYGPSASSSRPSATGSLPASKPIRLTRAR